VEGVSVVRTLLIAVGIVAASVWVGSLVCLALVANVSRKVLGPGERVELFRRVGRVYGIVGTVSLLVGIGVAAALSWPPGEWTATGNVAAALCATLVVLTGVGMAQARRMTTLRQLAVGRPHGSDAARKVARGSLVAGVLRASIAAVTLALVVLAAQFLSVVV
jgi:hypothetical protein